MRIADVDAFVQPREEWLKKELKKNHNEEYRRGYLEGVRVTLFELQDERFTPTVYANPCDFCAYNPPSSCDGKPCTLCPAQKKIDEVSE